MDFHGDFDTKMYSVATDPAAACHRSTTRLPEVVGQLLGLRKTSSFMVGSIHVGKSLCFLLRSSLVSYQGPAFLLEVISVHL